MARTTIDLDPGLLEELKHLAARGRESMSRVANRLLRDAMLTERKARAGAPPFRWHIVPGGEPGPGFDPANRDYLDLLDEAP